MNEDERLDRLLRGYEDALLAAPDEDFELSVGEQTVAGIVGGVLKAYGYQRDGARFPVSWRRERTGRRAPLSRPQSRARVAAEPLRASFNARQDDFDDNGEDGSDR